MAQNSWTAVVNNANGLYWWSH